MDIVIKAGMVNGKEFVMKTMGVIAGSRIDFGGKFPESRIWSTAYVEIPKGHPDYGKNVLEYEGYEVHGGVTFAGSDITNYRSIDRDEKWYIGFDTNRSLENDGREHPAYMMEQINLLSEQIDERNKPKNKTQRELAKSLEKLLAIKWEWPEIEKITSKWIVVERVLFKKDDAIRAYIDREGDIHTVYVEVVAYDKENETGIDTFFVAKVENDIDAEQLLLKIYNMLTV